MRSSVGQSCDPGLHKVLNEWAEVWNEWSGRSILYGDLDHNFARQNFSSGKQKVVISTAMEGGGEVSPQKDYKDMTYLERRKFRRMEHREQWDAYWKLMDFETKGTLFNRVKWYVWRSFDAPVTFFRENIIEPLHDAHKKPYYHYQYDRVRDVDECVVDDDACIYEANVQFYRDLTTNRKQLIWCGHCCKHSQVDCAIKRLLFERVNYCTKWYRDKDIAPCVPTIDDYEHAELNLFIKYGEVGYNTNALDAYSKQKHRLIWERQHPEVMEARQKEWEKHKADMKKGIFDMTFWKNEQRWFVAKDKHLAPYDQENCFDPSGEPTPLSRNWKYYKNRDGQQPSFDPPAAQKKQS